MSIDPKNLRGFTDHFAEEFVIPQINFWQSNINPKVKIGSGLMTEYYENMRSAVADLKIKFSPPYKSHSSFPLHEVVITIEEVEMLKGIIGDNYQYLKNRIEEKKNLGVSFMDTTGEEKELDNLEIYLTHVVPNFGDSRERNLFIPFENLNKNKKDDRNEDDEISLPRDGIFLSHSSKDKEIVRWFRNAFEKEGIKVWFDESEILPGDSIIQKISNGMKKSKYVAIFISENLNFENMSQYVGWELSMAKVKDLEDKEGRLIPIMIGISSGIKLPQEVIDKNYADFRNKELKSDDLEFQRLLRKIKM